MSDFPESSQWFRHLQAEDLLRSLGLPIVARTVPMKDIDLDAGLGNNARREALDKERVERYTERWIKGGSFPAVVLRHFPDRKTKKDMPLGGNHRLQSADKAKVPEAVGYIVETDDDELAERIAFLLNNIEGIGNPEEERVDRAVRMVQKYGWSNKKAAEELAVSESALNREMRARRVAERLSDCGIRGSKLLPSSTLADLDVLEDNKVLAGVFSVAANAHLTGDACKEILRKVKKKNDRDEQLGIIEAEVKLLGVSSNFHSGNGHTTEAPPPRTKKYSIFRFILNRAINFLLENPTFSKMGITKKSDQEWFREKINQLVKLLRGV